MITSFRLWLSIYVLALPSAPSLRAGQTDSGTFKPVIDETKGMTLFAFDNVSIPFTRSLRLELHRPEKFAGNPIVARGPRSEPDHWGVQFYGSIVRVGEKFRMWYGARSMTWCTFPSDPMVPGIRAA